MELFLYIGLGILFVYWVANQKKRAHKQLNICLENGWLKQVGENHLEINPKLDKQQQIKIMKRCHFLRLSCSIGDLDE